MATLERIRVTWSGSGVVGPGLTTFFFTQPTGALPSAVRTFFSSLAALFPPSVTIQVPNNGDLIDEATGALAGTWTVGSTPAAVVGSSAGAFQLGVGAQVRWRTAGIVGGRRSVGSTFLVPATGGAFDTDGTLQSTSVTLIQNAANALIVASPNLAVWSRPKGIRSGVAHVVTAATVPDRPSWLRSRRR